MVLFSELGGDPDDEDDDPDGEDDLLGGADDGMMGAGDEMFGGDEASDDEELNYRLDEVEKEIDALGNKVETVRGENEQISDSIESVERNVDKLVDMYEIVTHGVNPFAADQEIGDAFESATGQDGLIGSDDEDEIDPDIASAEADDFLDDDLPIGDETEDDFDDVTGDPDSALEDEPLEADDMEDDMTLDDDPDDDIEQFLPDGEDDSFQAGEDELEDDSDDLAADDDPDEFETDETLAEEDALEPEADLDETDDELAADDGDALEADDDVSDAERAANGEIGEPPYLARHPSRPDAEVAALEWLEYLVETAGVDGAARTIAYYESIGWISPGIETYLHALLAGFGEETTVPEDEPDPRSGLSTAEHKRSLQYISTIATPEKRDTSFAEDVLEDGDAPDQ